MEKYSNILKGFLFGVLLTLMVVAIFEPNSRKNNEFMNKVQDKAEDILQIMDKYYLEEYDEDAMADGMLSGMLYAVGDPYTGYYDKESYASLMESSEGVYYGIGVVVSQNPDTLEVYVVNPYEECPGYEAGMRPGDVIVAVGDTPVTDMDLNEVVAMIRGEENTYVDISVIHEGANEIDKLKVLRRKIETHTVETKLLDSNIGYIQVTQFDTVTTDQFKQGMDELVKTGAKSVIIDLRDNPGGSLDTVIDMLDAVLEPGIYTYLVDKNGSRKDYTGKHAALYDMPLVVLVNENSASASELFTGAVKDYKRAVIVGTTTFGKGIVQQVFPLSDGTGMKVTMAKYYTPEGVCIHKTGIEPDVVVELDPGEYISQISIEEDEQLQAAINILK